MSNEYEYLDLKSINEKSVKRCIEIFKSNTTINHITHRISDNLINWIFSNYTSDINGELIKEIDQWNHMTYLRFLKFRHIFYTLKYDSLLEADLKACFDQPLQVSCDIVREFLSEKEFLKDKDVSYHQFSLVWSLFTFNMRKKYTQLEFDQLFKETDFKFYFLLHGRLAMTETEFSRLYGEYRLHLKGITKYILLNLTNTEYQYIFTYPKSIDMFLKYIEELLEDEEKTIKVLIRDAVEEVNSFGIKKIGVHEEEQLIMKCEQLLEDKMTILGIYS